MKSGQATSSTALGDYAGTGCAERFYFFRVLVLLSSLIVLLLEGGCLVTLVFSEFGHLISFEVK